VRNSGVIFSKIMIVGTPILATLAIAPGLTYDPINLPKALVVITGASFLLTSLIVNFSKLFQINKLLPFFAIIFICPLLFSLVVNDAPTSQQLWGVWGRSTGVLTYLAFTIFLLASAIEGEKKDQISLRRGFERLSYFISIYTLAQAGEIDPINWSQKLMVATLGNINFMSSFLGLATISMLSRIIIEKLSVTSKLFFGLFAALNLFLIWISGSIQGIAVVAAGLSILIMLKARKERGLWAPIAWISSVTPFGILILLGTAGVGPLNALKQETVIFRIDYWLAGVRMTKENWLNGVGVDSYGDFYEQYRDLAAVERTGPQRITNTAHNIFLDVSSGAGIFAGVAFVAIFLIVLGSVVQMTRSAKFTDTDAAFAGMFFGFLVFAMISINQIGVGIWGFVFMGSLVGSSARQKIGVKRSEIENSQARTSSSNASKVPDSRTNASFILSMILGMTVFIVGLQPVITDAKMLRAVQNSDFQAMKESVSRSTATAFHKSKFQTLLVQGGRESEALNFAREDVAQYPRSETSLRIVAFSETALKSERVRAAELLKARDPFNYELQRILDEMLETLP
jgi:hypothetical protein